MSTIEIPRAEWTAFLDSFSRQHQGWLATVEVIGPELGAQIEIHELPLNGVSFEEKGSDQDTILIDVSQAELTHATHTVSAPRHMRLLQTEEGAHKALELESADGLKTIVRFRSAVLPEMVDGVVT